MATASPSPFAVPPEAVPTKAELLAQAEARNMELEARNMDVAVARDKAQNAYRKAALRNKEQAQARSKAVAKARTKYREQKERWIADFKVNAKRRREEQQEKDRQGVEVEYADRLAAREKETAAARKRARDVGSKAKLADSRDPAE